MTLTEEQRGTVGFDLEKNRAAIDSAINSLLCEGWDNEASTVRRIVAEIERLRAENLELQGEVFGPDGIRANQACIIADQAASISELEIEITELKADLEQSERVIEARLDVIDQQAARIKELEDALVEAKAAIKFCLDEGDEDENYGPMHDLPEWRELPEKDKDIFRDWCRKRLQAEDKIGPGTVAPPCWQITEERVEALHRAIRGLSDPNFHHSNVEKETAAVLRAMLKEAE